MARVNKKTATAKAKPPFKKAPPKKVARKKTRAKVKAGDKRLGNQFWQLRTKHGRDKLFEHPDILWQAACEYFQWCDDNPLQSLEYNGKDAKKCIVPKMRAYTWTGLEYYLDVYSLRDYKTNPEYKDFSQVITRIERVIYTQKFEGAAAGLLNANIIARDLGLAEKGENKNDNRNTNYHSKQLTADEIKDIGKALEDEC